MKCLDTKLEFVRRLFVFFKCERYGHVWQVNLQNPIRDNEELVAIRNQTPCVFCGFKYRDIEDFGMWSDRPDHIVYLNLSKTAQYPALVQIERLKIED